MKLIRWIQEVTGLEVGATNELEPEPIITTKNYNCIDTDGDGWGWDATGSYQPPQQNPGNTERCIDTDNDGWGWSGTKSCRMVTLTK